MSPEFPHLFELLVKFIKSIFTEPAELLLALVGFVVLASLFFLLLQFKRRLSSKLLEVERKGQAKRELELGLSLLRRGRVGEADVRFGTALVLWPEIVDSFSKQKQERVMAELASLAGGLKATELWLQLAERRQSRQETHSPATASEVVIKRARHMIAETIRQELATRFPTLRVVAESVDGAALAIPARHPEVGDVLIRDDGWEATLSIGSIGHDHFSDYRDDISENERAKAIVEDVLAFLGMLLSDRVLLWKSGESGGGWRVLDDGEIPEVHSDAGTQFFVWSGPLAG